MWSKSNSVKLTTILTWLCLAAAVAAAFLIPVAVRWYDRVSLRGSVFVPLCATLYASLLPAFIALSRLMNLLGSVRRGEVFTKASCDDLRALSYCCFSVTVIFCAFGFYRELAFLVAFAAAFMGLILRVLKNVFEEAVALREENDAVI